MTFVPRRDLPRDFFIKKRREKSGTKYLQRHDYGRYQRGAGR